MHTADAQRPALSPRCAPPRPPAKRGAAPAAAPPDAPQPAPPAAEADTAITGFVFTPFDEVAPQLQGLDDILARQAADFGCRVPGSRSLGSPTRPS
jgi:hypothetical protein